MVESGGFASSHSSSVGLCHNPGACRAPRHLNRRPLYSILDNWFLSFPPRPWRRYRGACGLLSRRSKNSTMLHSQAKVSYSWSPPGFLVRLRSTSRVAYLGSSLAMSLEPGPVLLSASKPSLPRKILSQYAISTTDEMNASRATGSCLCTCLSRWRFAFHDRHTATAAASRPSPWIH